jgi:ribonuclease HIII
VRIDYSQLKDRAIAEEIQGLIEGKPTVSGALDAEENALELGYPIIGSDESGKGDYFGPLVTGAVYVDEPSAKKLVELGVKDSKHLTDQKVQWLYRAITSVCGGRFKVIAIFPERYNDLHRDFKAQGKNLNALLGWSHATAIKEVLSKADCETVIVDQFGDERYVREIPQKTEKDLRLIQRTKGENHIAVAAASILARAKFLWSLRSLSEKYGMNLSKLAVIEDEKAFVRKYGDTPLGKVAKLHFKITDKVLPA